VKDNFSDFFGMLWHWGIHPAPMIISGCRALAAGLTLLFALLAMRDFVGNQLLQAFAVMLLAAALSDAFQSPHRGEFLSSCWLASPRSLPGVT
jgi:hypothetical protein